MPTIRSIAIPSASAEALLSDTSISMPDLLIEGLLPKAGLVLIAGRPKDGKSWFACQLGLSVVTGSALGGWLRVKQPGRVQLWSLEDGFALTKDKISKLLNGARPDSLADLRIYPSFRLQFCAVATMQSVASWMRSRRMSSSSIRSSSLPAVPSHGLIFAKPTTASSIGSQGRPGAQLRRRDHHAHKKGARGGNPIENATGTSGTTAAADSVAELKRTSAREGKLTVVGRLVPGEEYAMEWNGGPQEWGWSITGDGQDAALGETSLEILAYLEAQGACKPSSIASGISRSFASVWSALKRLQERGKVLRGRDKRWELSGR